eukprot:47670-Eustigmatos_ZCMA.PRE.1
MMVMMMALTLPFATIILPVRSVDHGKGVFSGRLAPQKCYSTACTTNGNLMAAQHWAVPHHGNTLTTGTDMSWKA